VLDKDENMNVHSKTDIFFSFLCFNVVATSYYFCSLVKNRRCNCVLFMLQVEITPATYTVQKTLDQDKTVTVRSKIDCFCFFGNSTLLLLLLAFALVFERIDGIA